MMHFTADEVLYLGASNDDATSEAYQLNELPPVYLWCNIIDTVLLLDALRTHFKVPVVILNGFRSKDYNNKIGGAKNSLHKEFCALDFYVTGIETMVVAQKLKEWRIEGKFKGGIGTYNSFIHLDTRGVNATWEG